MFSNVLKLFINVFFLIGLRAHSWATRSLLIRRLMLVCVYEALAVLMCVQRASCCFIKIWVITDVVVEDIWNHGTNSSLYYPLYINILLCVLVEPLTHHLKCPCHCTYLIIRKLRTKVTYKSPKSLSTLTHKEIDRNRTYTYKIAWLTYLLLTSSCRQEKIT
jgi:hypothetical protein